MTSRNFKLLLSTVLFYGFVASCTPSLVGPSDPKSSLVIGRIVVDNTVSWSV